jgi:release factor glutamine methyltransferase
MVLKPGGELFFEISEGQGNALRDLLEGHGFADVRILKDYAGLERYATARQSV